MINKYHILCQHSTGSVLIAEPWGLQQKRWELTWSCHTRWGGWRWGRLTPGWSPQGSTPWGEEKGSYFFTTTTTKGWVPDMLYIRHPVRPFLVQTLHLNVLTIHIISYWPKWVGETWIKAQPGRVVTELCMRNISCYGIPILPELRRASWDLRLPFVNNKLLEKEVRLYTVCQAELKIWLQRASDSLFAG